MTDLPDILAAIVLTPGDRLVIAAPAGTTERQINHLQRDLERRGYHQTLIFAGAEALMTVRADGSSTCLTLDGAETAPSGPESQDHGMLVDQATQDG